MTAEEIHKKMVEEFGEGYGGDFEITSEVSNA